MPDIEYWKQNGFRFEAHFQDEYDLWINPKTLQKLRRYIGGQEWLSDLKTGDYRPVVRICPSSCCECSDEIAYIEAKHPDRDGSKRLLPVVCAMNPDVDKEEEDE